MKVVGVVIHIAPQGSLVRLWTCGLLWLLLICCGPVHAADAVENDASSTDESVATGDESHRQVTLILDTGGEIRGRFIGKSPTEYVIGRPEGTIGIKHSHVSEVVWHEGEAPVATPEIPADEGGAVMVMDEEGNTRVIDDEPRDASSELLDDVEWELTKSSKLPLLGAGMVGVLLLFWLLMPSDRQRRRSRSKGFREVAPTPVRASILRRFLALIVDGLGISAGAFLFGVVGGTVMAGLGAAGFAEQLIPVDQIQQLFQVPAQNVDGTRVPTDAEMRGATTIVAGLAGTIAYTSMGFMIFQFLWIIWEGLTGRALGKILLGIQIYDWDGYDASTGALMSRSLIKNVGAWIFIPISISGSAILGLLGAFVCLIVFFGFFLALGARKQTLHDRLTRTCVFHR